ncbi:pVII [Fowl aviadenovirus D]|uniref:pVII n=1 Tax=Fowl aviadenovirus D TaxID=190064 RepID=UPI00001D9766|nr:pVII [Fowl aviadenovirus D]
MSILISPNDNRGWGMRRRSSMRGVGIRRRRLTLRTLLGLGTSSRRRSGGRSSRRRSRPASTTTRVMLVRTSPKKETLTREVDWKTQMEGGGMKN